MFRYIDAQKYACIVYIDIQCNRYRFRNRRNVPCRKGFWKCTLPFAGENDQREEKGFLNNPFCCLSNSPWIETMTPQ